MPKIYNSGSSTTVIARTTVENTT